jgi:hypothetical protein
MVVVDGKWETEYDLRIGVNVRRAVLAGLYMLQALPVPLYFRHITCRLADQPPG